MNKFTSFFQKIPTFFKIKEKTPDYLQNEQFIMKLLFYFEFTKISTSQSILLFQKIEENFKNEIKNRENFANNELKIINNFENGKSTNN